MADLGLAFHWSHAELMGFRLPYLMQLHDRAVMHLQRLYAR